MPHSAKKLRERKRVHVEKLHLADRKRARRSRQHDAEQRAGASYVVLGSHLGERLERSDCRRTVLDLVEDEEGVFCVDGLTHRKGDVLKHAPRIMGTLE